MILVDTSLWIQFFRRDRPFDLEAVVDVEAVVTCLPVIQEVLQGFRDERAYRIARTAMFNLQVVDNPLPSDAFEQAVSLYRTARRAGVTVRSSVDCLIAATAIRHDLEVLHRDRDYARLAALSPLRQRSL